MNNPYPTKARLAHERRADRLLNLQATAVTQYQGLLVQFAAGFNALEFPLGSPAKYFEMKDISDMIDQMALPQEVGFLEEAAMELSMEDA